MPDIEQIVNKIKEITQDLSGLSLGEQEKKGGEIMGEETKTYTQADVDALVNAALENYKAKVENGKELEETKAEIIALNEKINVMSKDFSVLETAKTKAETDFEDYKKGIETEKLISARLQEFNDKGVEVKDTIDVIKSIASKSTDEEWQKYLGFVTELATAAKKSDDLVTASEKTGKLISEVDSETTDPRLAVFVKASK